MMAPGAVILNQPSSVSIAHLRLVRGCLPGGPHAPAWPRLRFGGPPPAAPVTGAATAFGQAGVSSATSRTVSVTAARSVTVTGAAATVTFPTVDVPLAGDGAQPRLGAEPEALAFALAPDHGAVDVPVGTAVPEIVDITNYGTTTDTVTSVSPPSGPFIAAGLPRIGTRIRPGRSIPVQVTFAPAAAGPASGSFTISGSSGPGTTVTLSGVGTGAVSQLTAARQVVRFGTIQAGKQAIRYVHVTNSGNTPARVTRTSLVPSPFAAPLRPERNLPSIPVMTCRFR
jgi:hypothetical protein